MRQPSTAHRAEDQARVTAERVARHAYARLLAFLAARTGNLHVAEDALSDAFRAALETWPGRGIPDNPEAWLVRTARNRILDRVRHGKVVEEASGVITLLIQELADAQAEFPDERLKLLFICAHPAIDPAIRTPLMLQTVLGLDAARIASAFLVAPATMSQRLVRAKNKIRIACIPFEVPEWRELPERLDAVLDAIYAAFGTGWDDASGGDPKRRGLATEAIWLARLLVSLLPGEPEAKGLLALMLHSEARRSARRNRQGDYVPLSEQRIGDWDRGLIEDAEAMLAQALEGRGIGRYRLEAAIQSAHVVRIIHQRNNWPEIAALYDRLTDLAPTIGALVSRAAALSEARSADEGLAALAELPAERVATYQPFWAVKADLLARQGAHDAARDAYTRAIGLAEDEAVRRYLTTKQDVLGL